MEPKRSYRAFREEVPEEEEVGEIGVAQVVQEGDALTAVAWGAMMPLTLEAAQAVQERRGVRVEVIDLLTIAPLDAATVAASVRKTGRCVVVQEAPKSLGGRVGGDRVHQRRGPAFAARAGDARNRV